MTGQAEQVQVVQGDARLLLPTLPAESIHCCVTSPPFFNLRDYGTAEWEGGSAECDHVAPSGQGKTGDRASRTFTASQPYKTACGKCGAVRQDRQIGLEATPADYVAALAAVFVEVWRVLRKDGTCWLNLGDSYNSYNGNAKQGGPVGLTQSTARPHLPTGYGLTAKGLKPKDLIGIPWRVAFALQEAGWWLRSDIIWAKPNPMPESVIDRPTRSHEYIFLLTKSDRYYYDYQAIREPMAPASASRYAYGFGGAKNEHLKAGDKPTAVVGSREMTDGRNKRDVWTVATTPYPGSHFATFPPELIAPCILAGCPAGGVVLDPFAGSGTTLAVARGYGRRAVGIELNPEYCQLAEKRIYSKPATLFSAACEQSEPAEQMTLGMG